MASAVTARTEASLLPEAIVGGLNLYCKAGLTLDSSWAEVTPQIAVLAGDLLDPLHLLLTEIACEDTPLHCAKMRFAAAAVDSESRQVIATGFNSRIRATLYGLSEPLYCRGDDCVRIKGKSRSDALVGECEHAFLVTILSLTKMGVDLSLLEGPSPRIRLYEAGFSHPKPDPKNEDPVVEWLPWVAREPIYTCLYCEDRLIMAGIEEVWAIKKLPDQDAPTWTAINLRQSLISDSRTAQEGYLKG